MEISVRGLRFSQRCWWFKSLGAWHRFDRFTEWKVALC